MIFQLTIKPHCLINNLIQSINVVGCPLAMCAYQLCDPEVALLGERYFMLNSSFEFGDVKGCHLVRVFDGGAG